MLTSAAPLGRLFVDADARMTRLLGFLALRDLTHVSISGSVATYLIGATERDGFNAPSLSFPSADPA
jgi:hypothetical protein